MFNGFCMKCRVKRDVQETDSAVNKNGSIRIWGPCPVCGTNVNTMKSGKTKEAG